MCVLFVFELLPPKRDTLPVSYLNILFKLLSKTKDLRHEHRWGLVIYDKEVHYGVIK